MFAQMFYGIGWWVIFPIIGLVFLVLMMSMMFGFRRRGPGSGRRMGPMCMGHMAMGDHSEEDDERADNALGLLRRRYAAGELTDEQFDAMRGKLEDQA
ncbi:MAG: SHOCT domain-containing protein [Acidobacteria bacterium]|nr:SHOCT domain-containing protein [Acidobacteriota bacterium]